MFWMFLQTKQVNLFTIKGDCWGEGDLKIVMFYMLLFANEMYISVRSKLVISC